MDENKRKKMLKTRRKKNIVHGKYKGKVKIKGQLGDFFSARKRKTYN